MVMGAVSLYHDVSWIGPLFLLNAVACIVAIAGLADAAARPHAPSPAEPPA
jgi:hypothetical protein